MTLNKPEWPENDPIKMKLEWFDLQSKNQLLSYVPMSHIWWTKYWTNFRLGNIFYPSFVYFAFFVIGLRMQKHQSSSWPCDSEKWIIHDEMHSEVLIIDIDCKSSVTGKSEWRMYNTVHLAPGESLWFDKIQTTIRVDILED